MSFRAKYALFLSLLLILPLTRAVTAWADLFDPCGNLDGPGRYRELTPPDEDYIHWASPPDSSYLCQSSNRRQASATYYCPGAEEAVVAIYSRHGCWAGQDGDTLFRGGEELPLRYCPGDGEVYCGGRRMVYDGELMDFVFLEQEDRPAGLENYGLSAAVSPDGEDYESASCTLLSVEREGSDAYFYEVYRVELGAGCTYLRLTLTDQSSIQILGREERYRFDTTGGLALASVEIFGEGPEPEPEPEPEPPAGPSDPGEPSRPSAPDAPSAPAGPSEDEPPPVSGSSGGDSSLPALPTDPGEAESPLPTLPPEEGEDPHRGDWGPVWTEEEGEGPAFPEEMPEAEKIALPPQKTAGKAEKAESAAGSSGSSRSTGSQSAAPPGREAPEETGDNGMIAGRRPLVETAAQGTASGLRRSLEPQMVTTLGLSAALLAVGLRLLWRR